MVYARCGCSDEDPSHWIQDLGMLLPQTSQALGNCTGSLAALLLQCVYQAIPDDKRDQGQFPGIQEHGDRVSAIQENRSLLAENWLTPVID
jgi:hypothetical protein